MWVWKKSVNGTAFRLRACRRRVFVSVRLRGGGENRCGWLTEEAHQSLDVLSYRCQEELLAHESESPQTQAPQSDLILQFREQGFHLLSCRRALANSGVLTNSRARCRTGSFW